jgi:DNA invertase Pin-like site-specific DNA recombinase
VTAAGGEWGKRAGVGAYVRVSTKAQSHDLQVDAISRAAAARGEEITHWYAEKRSGKILDRPKLAELLGDAQKGELVKVYVFRVDRLTRRGIRDTLSIVEALRSCGCLVTSVADGFLLDGPAGDVILAVMAWAAQVEGLATSERISAARETVEAAGGRWGRPRRVNPGEIEKARELVAGGLSIREISQRLRVPRATLQRALAQKGHYAETPPSRA